MVLLSARLASFDPLAVIVLRQPEIAPLIPTYSIFKFADKLAEFTHAAAHGSVRGVYHPVVLAFFGRRFHVGHNTTKQGIWFSYVFFFNFRIWATWRHSAHSIRPGTPGSPFSWDSSSLGPPVTPTRRMRRSSAVHRGGSSWFVL